MSQTYVDHAIKAFIEGHIDQITDAYYSNRFKLLEPSSIQTFIGTLKPGIPQDAVARSAHVICGDSQYVASKIAHRRKRAIDHLYESSKILVRACNEVEIEMHAMQRGA